MGAPHVSSAWRHVTAGPDWVFDGDYRYERTRDDGTTEYARDVPNDERPPAPEGIREYAEKMQEAADGLAALFKRG